MNILAKIYKNSIDMNEVNKTVKYLCVRELKSAPYFYIGNEYGMNTDLAYSKLLDLSIDAFRMIMYDDVDKASFSTTFVFVKRVDAIRKKFVLAVLLINKFHDFNKVKKELRELSISL